MEGRIYQINVKPEIAGERGLPKTSVESAIVSYSGINGDFNRYRQEKHNGRPDWALLLIPFEMIEQLNQEGWAIHPGDIGENITTIGIPYEDFSPDKKYRVGEIEIQISEPCTPCGSLKILAYIGKERWPEFKKTMQGRRGWYAKVLKEGKISRGDLISRIE